ncbi:MAG TPA: integrase arm-type DNA-binding domain-containing protein [Nitrococcus sp.]|nr:integrase arm-type DNA-binding domain-containing protein [Nitrococcus sp.]
MTDTKIRTLKPRSATYRVADGNGLCIEVRSTGSKSWRYRYRHAGKANMLGLGEYPAVSLAEARARRDEASRLLAAGVNPAMERKVERRDAKRAAANTFGKIADEWLIKQPFADVTRAKAKWMFELASALRDRSIAELTPPEVLDVLRGIEARGTHETAHRVKQRIGQVFRFAIATGRAQHDVTADLRGALTPVVTTSRAAIIDPQQIGGLLRAIDGYQGQPVTRAALRLAPRLFVRPGNLRAMEWDELDFEAGEWRIPAGKMKMREAHIVPLASQVIAILRDLQSLTGRGRYCLPSLRTGDRPMSENTINAALRRLGYDKEEMCGHGFRAMASSILNEQGYHPDWIERQLGHAERNRVRAAYNRAQYLPERRKMMQAWADYLDGLAAGAPPSFRPLLRDIYPTHYPPLIAYRRLCSASGVVALRRAWKER